MQPHYRHAGYSHAGQQGPQRPLQPSQRRGGIGPMVMPGGQPTPNRAALHPAMPTGPQAQHDASELAHSSLNAAKRRSRKPADKNLPEGIEDCLIESELAQRYKDLRDLEQRLDAIITRKRLDMVDTIHRHGKRSKTLRIWISNTVEDQPWQVGGVKTDAFDFSRNLEASYRVKIEGRLLDDDDDSLSEQASSASEEGAEGSSGSTRPARPKARGPSFTHFFQRMEVEFDKSYSRAAANQTVSWVKARSSKSTASVEDFDELTFKRNGSENMNITIFLTRHEDPERYKLSNDLSDIVDMPDANRQDVLTGIWEYIKFMGLQEDEEKRIFRCDELLKKIVPNSDVCSISDLDRFINAHLEALDPVQLPYTIRVDEEFHEDPQPTIYDIEVSVDEPLRAKALPFIMNPAYAENLREIVALDEHLALVAEAVSASKAKHTFFTSLGQDPAIFMKDWLSSQKRDLEVIMGEAPRGISDDVTTDNWRRGGPESVWASSNARESVSLLLARPSR
ncbi:hypothetical protein SODALDRAFT_37335 [Sodiomyces alkalinus F11]|uniref:DM2 domain-containing protein n=1 Tax=Sodiomyces alkalinus (strain CBS 110278 / VKM F-3762 / F11) TaxID=1314773 RepID=A0A3N2Q9C1_SODAK|nr:hypothetical protein SODALDRAFT_37335 [Sodiomyces alkalinus F11]ROT43360.1 hypothetical protein SODALDRAFT_37335 [Sodiomyces alkalinus F11]